MAKLWLCRIEIRDGEREYMEYGLVEANTLEKAEKIIETTLPVDELGLDKEGTEWGFVGETASKLVRIEEITKEEAEVLRKKIGLYTIT